MNDLRTAAQQALEALEGWDNHDRWVWPESALEQAKRNTTEALAALRAALAQQAEPVEPVQQPYCYVYEYDGAFGLHREFYPKVYNGHKPDRTVPVYTAPPQRKPLPKQDQHCVDVPGYGLVSVRLVRAIERALGITDPQVEDRLARHGIPMPEGDPK